MEQMQLVNANPATGNPEAGQGSAGLQSQTGNQPVTVSGAQVVAPAGTTPTPNAMNAGGFIEPDIDEELFKFSSDDTPLMNLMLKAKTVNVSSPEVDHYSIDEPTSMVTVQSVNEEGVITLVAADRMKVHAYDVLSVVGVEGYIPGTTTKSGKPLQLFVTSVNANGGFTVKATNGIKTNATDEYGELPTASNPASNTNYIKNGGATKMVLLGNALYETQMHVDPDLVLPQPERIYLQKRGMNQIVSDYFESQRKRVPFSNALIAEAAIRNFKVKGNRTLWISQPAKFRVRAEKTGDMQFVYNTTGVRWQFKRELEHQGPWTYEQFIALAKLFYTGEDVPDVCIGLTGKDFLQNIQCIDWSKHPEVKIEVKKNEKLGWKVTAFTTVFGELQFKREPTLDRIGYENCAALIGQDRLVHYKRTAEKSFNEKVEGEEAKRNGVLVWDALCLKGSCHIWVDGKGGETAPNAQEYFVWDTANAYPTNPAENGVYMFTTPTAIAAITGKSPAFTAAVGSMYKYTTANGWEPYNEKYVAAG